MDSRSQKKLSNVSKHINPTKFKNDLVTLSPSSRCDCVRVTVLRHTVSNVSILIF